MAMADGQLVWNEAPTPAAALAAGLMFIGVGIWLLRRDRVLQLTFAAFVGLIFAFSIFVYPLAIRHVSLALVLLILSISLLPGAHADDRRLLDACLALGALCGIAMGISNLVRPFDTAPSAAAYILDHHLEGEHWVSFPDSRGQGVSALTGIEFERLERGCTQSFIRWNYRSRIKQPRDLEQELERVAARSGGFYLLTDFNLLDVPIRNAAAYQQLFYVPAGVDGQPFYLYRVRPDLPKKGAPLPQCAPKRLPMPALLRA
jgi:hypothetical protein